MSKALDIMMAGIISGIVVYTTSKLGIGGTIIGAVLGSMLYQLMSHFFREPLGKVKTQKVETRIVYTLPLVLILAVEIIYLLVPFYLTSEQIFYLLEGATGWNLFRSIGIGLILMGIYPIIEPENIKRIYGYIVTVLGVVVLLRGFLDADSAIVKLYSDIFSQFDSLISIMVIVGLFYVILSVIKESVTIFKEKNEEAEDDELENKGQTKLPTFWNEK
jgi:hypothetical protein